MHVNISAMWVSIALWSLIYRTIFRVNLLKNHRESPESGI